MTSSLIFVMRETLPYIWCKHSIEPRSQEHLASAVVDGVRKLVHVESFLAAHEWEPFLRKHFLRMAVTQRNFSHYTLFALNLVSTEIKNVRDLYLKTMAVAVYFALYFHSRKQLNAIHVVRHILEKFIEDEFSEDIVDEEFWRDVSNHVVRKGYLEHYLVVERMLREGRSKRSILKAIARDSTVNTLSQHAAQVAMIEAADIEQNELIADIVDSMDRIVYQEKPRAIPTKKMKKAQKLLAVTRLEEELKKISMKQFSFDRLIKLAEEDLEVKGFMRKKAVEASKPDEEPSGLLLDCLHDVRNYL